MPITPEQLAADVRACLAEGATSFHVHPRDEHGTQTLEARHVDAAIRAMRAAGGTDLGVTTSADVEPDRERARRLIEDWREPDHASVNFSESGAVALAEALLGRGIGVEAGIWSPEDAERLIASGLATRVARILVEPVDPDPSEALAAIEAIHTVLDRAGVRTPRLQHADGAATWLVLEDAVRRGLATRIGFEDTLALPDGTLAQENADLVIAAHELQEAPPTAPA